jgi:hypothetical protein
MADDPLITAPGRVPDAFPFAEVAAFPLTAEVAFRHAMTRLDPALDDDHGGHTSALWRACEATMAEQVNWSLDRLVALRDLTWFGSEAARRGARAEPVTIAHYIEALARMHLARTPGLTWAVGPDGEASTISDDRQRWLAFSLPEDLLLGALGVEPAPQRILANAPLLLRRLLDLGVAEIHQHIGAGMEFSLLWVSTLATLASPRATADLLAGPGVPFSDGAKLVHWLSCAAVARCLLAEHLDRVRSGRAVAPLRSLLDEGTSLSPGQRRVLHQVVRALQQGRDDALPDFLALQELYAALHPNAAALEDTPLTSVDDAYERCDPVAQRLRLRGTNCGERWLIREALAYLHREPQGPDELFEVLWWQIVRLRCQLYRTIVERPLTAGLQWFLRFYNRISRLREPLAPILIEASYFAAGAGEPIAALEVRTTAGRTAVETAEKLLGMLRSWKRVLGRTGERPAAPEFGVLLHFVKARDIPPHQAWDHGSPAAFWAGTQADTSALQDLSRGRYLQFFTQEAGTAQAIASLVEAVPSVLWLLRGLDIASDELGVPTWVFVPLLAHVREVADVASQRPGSASPLGITAHVGEDFRHLLEGMRRVFEQIHYLLGPRGGRLGHAVALGLDPRAWSEAAGVVAMPAEDRLWDLVFEWRLHTRHRTARELASQPPAGRLDRINDELRVLSEAVFGMVVEPHVLAELHHALHRFLLPRPGHHSLVVDGGLDSFERGLARLWDDDDVRERKKVHHWLRAHLFDDGVFRRGQALVDVQTDALELAALFAVQASLRRAVAQRGIVVEVNPSSNLLIGDLADLRNHPILRLCPPERADDDLPPVAIAIGSDDPVTFSTSLLHEYVLLHRAARAAGYPERSVHAWLDTIRRTGMDARMTVTWRPSAHDKARELECALAWYLSLPSRWDAFQDSRGGGGP